jgi:hypothetical protein
MAKTPPIRIVLNDCGTPAPVFASFYHALRPPTTRLVSFCPRFLSPAGRARSRAGGSARERCPLPCFGGRSLERGDLQLLHDLPQARHAGRHGFGVVGIFEPRYAAAEMGDSLLDHDLDGEIGRRRVLP